MTTETPRRHGAAGGLVTALLIAALALVGVAPAAHGATGAPASAPAGVDDFEFASFHAEYALDRDADGRSVLTTRETLVAVFPAHDQNRGILRAIPSHYQGIDTHLEIIAVTDETGRPRDYSVEADGDLDVLTIAVPKGRFVHGAQTYVIEYAQRDVTHFFADTARDEFYWDVNGTGWRQPFHRVSAELRVAPQLVAGLTGHTACYQGVEGSGDPCTIARVDEPDGAAVFTAVVESLAARENLTIAVGFAPRTFAEPEPSLVQRFAPLIAAGPAAGAALLGVVILLLRASLWRDAPRRRAIVAQYEPPAGVDLFLAADLAGQQRRAAVAGMLDLAVRGNARMLEHVVPLGGYPGLTVGAVAGPAGRRPGVPVFGIQALAHHGLTPAERTFADMLVPPGFAIGAARWFDRVDTTLAERIVSWRRETGRRAVELGLRRTLGGAVALVLALGLLVVAAETVGLVVLIDRIERTPWLMAPWLLGSAGTVATVLLVVAALRRRPLTAAGRDLADHLRGLQLFIRIAEADRLRMLQSASGAERIAVAAGSGGPAGAAIDAELAVVRVYERLLPYAVVFGLEREWLENLARCYQHLRPSWIVAEGGFHPAHLAGHVGGFVAQTSSSYSGSAGSSSSGGSGGGGSSGGGGGGGGGGGV
ncbi:DUF2207 domain-containing protein [Microbacterium sp. No. 7]|uniref:DUF2207 domain-containing protein n=1 Tax=Microbacterium sp. No. 7 TaxID=1714373 RepID=UPI0006D1C329|nr:DUF2207 domain-containing protein [Microbacterium sp. No. 7]ALJ20094.1 hypothetical protein AOA12_09300 [Microbacterium sp. No. 7]